jgi:hypothetical protein
MAARMVAGSSPRGLSSVTNTTSASFGGKGAHLRALGAVAIAAAAEHHHQPARRVRPQRFERMLQGIGRMGIVNEHRRSGAAGGDKLEPALGALEILKRPQRHGLLSPGRDDQTGSDKGVGDLEIAHQRQKDLVFHPAGLDDQLLRQALALAVDQLHGFAGRAPRSTRQGRAGGPGGRSGPLPRYRYSPPPWRRAAADR